MGILGKLFGGGGKKAGAVEAPPCPHAVLVPRWDSVADMGVEAKATGFMCDTCHQVFTPEEARQLRESIAERLLAPIEQEGASKED